MTAASAAVLLLCFVAGWIAGAVGGRGCTVALIVGILLGNLAQIAVQP